MLSELIFSPIRIFTKNLGLIKKDETIEWCVLEMKNTKCSRNPFFKKLKIEKLEITRKELIRGFINVKLKEI